MLSRKLTRVFIVVVAFAAITPLVAVPGWVTASSASGVVSIATPACGAVIFPSATAGSWVIPGTGVDAYSNGPSDEGTVSSCSSTSSTVNGIPAGDEWQCVEFINRLYITNGWIDATWLGSAGPTFYDNAPSSLNKQANGSVSYLGPGDIVVINVFYNGVADGGHALVVNDSSDVSSGTVSLVSQNSGYEGTTLPVVPGTISNGAVSVGGGGSGWTYTTIGVAHAPTAPTAPTTTPTYSISSSAKVLSSSRYGFDGPDAIASNGRYVWVANLGGVKENGDSITEINAATGALVRILNAPSYRFDGPSALFADGAHVWVANQTSNTVTEINESTGALVRVISSSIYGLSGPDAITGYGTHIWVVDGWAAGYGAITEINKTTGAFIRIFTGPKYQLHLVFSAPSAIAADATHIWVATTNGTVDEIDYATGALIHIFTPFPDGLGGNLSILADGTHVWVPNELNGDNSVTEINEANGGLVQIISGAKYRFHGNSDIAANGNFLWVTDGYGNSVTQMTENTGALVHVYSGAEYGFKRPWAIACDSAHVWVANYKGNSVTEFPVS